EPVPGMFASMLPPAVTVVTLPVVVKVPSSFCWKPAMKYDDVHGGMHVVASLEQTRPAGQRKGPGDTQPWPGTHFSSPSQSVESRHTKTLGALRQRCCSSSHESSVQPMRSSHAGLRFVQRPITHASAPLQNTPSSHWALLVHSLPAPSVTTSTSS